jgi:hypothetical protein
MKSYGTCGRGGRPSCSRYDGSALWSVPWWTLVKDLGPHRLVPPRRGVIFRCFHPVLSRASRPNIFHVQWEYTRQRHELSCVMVVHTAKKPLSWFFLIIDPINCFPASFPAVYLCGEGIHTTKFKNLPCILFESRQSFDRRQTHFTRQVLHYAKLGANTLNTWQEIFAIY